MTRRHTPATRRLQSRLERAELQHLREHTALQAERIEYLERELAAAESSADFWRESHHELADHLHNDTADGRAIGLTKAGELLVVRTAGHA